MASSTRGGKRGSSKPKRKTLKTYKTASGAQQYGSAEDFSDLSDRLHDKSMAIVDTGGKASDFADTISKMYKSEAGYSAARDKEFDDPYYKRGEKKALERSEHFKKLAQNKAKGGAVAKMKKGGAVPNNRKGFSKLPEEVQMKMDPEAAMKYMEGGAVKEYKYGGKVKGYKGGGSVCRGNGAAMSGIKKVKVR